MVAGPAGTIHRHVGNRHITLLQPDLIPRKDLMERKLFIMEGNT